MSVYAVSTRLFLDGLVWLGTKIRLHQNKLSNSIPKIGVSTNYMFRHYWIASDLGSWPVCIALLSCMDTCLNLTTCGFISSECGLLTKRKVTYSAAFTVTDEMLYLLLFVWQAFREKCKAYKPPRSSWHQLTLGYGKKVFSFGLGSCF